MKYSELVEIVRDITNIQMRYQGSGEGYWLRTDYRNEMDAIEARVARYEGDQRAQARG